MANLKKTRPIIALLLSLITPGLGQMYNGKLKRGIVFFLVCELLFILLHIFSQLLFEFHGFVLLLGVVAISLGFTLYVLLDALMGTKKLRVTVLKPYHKWYYYVGIFAAVLIINEVILEPILPDRKHFKPHKISSSGMAPALLAGDHLMTDRMIYKNEKPKRGDIIIFEFPKDPKDFKNPPKDFAKRVIGLEGEKVEIVKNKVYIDDKLIDDLWRYYESGWQNLKDLENFGPAVVPKDSLFVLGDNWYNSMDSRLFGFVDLSKTKGKALYIYWAKDKSRIGASLITDSSK